MQQYSYMTIPGQDVYELPPFVVKAGPALALDDLMAEAAVLASEMMPCDLKHRKNPADEELRRFNLGVTLAESYREFLAAWIWGDSVFEWIEQCLTTFERRPNLKPLLRPEIWPHVSDTCFVRLLENKKIAPAVRGKKGLTTIQAVGARLVFRRPPRIECLSDYFLESSNQVLLDDAFTCWSSDPQKSETYLPPERFHFHVTGNSIGQV